MSRWREKHRAVRNLLLATLAFLFPTPELAASTLRVEIGPGKIAALTDQNEIFLEAEPQRGEGLYAFTRRLTGSTESSRVISQLNGHPRRLLKGVRYRVPFERVEETFKVEILHSLFHADRAVARGWEHHVVDRAESPSLWRIAEWFTGAGENFRQIREANQLADDTLRPGQVLIIPKNLLFASLLAQVPLLDYERGPAGNYAIYRLRRGEALYSAVVVQFTGGTFAEDVIALAEELADLNQIADVTDMPVGQAIRIPFDMLLPEYLPQDDPRRKEYEKDRQESGKYSNTVKASRLEGITVILDAGHGGQDPGSSPGGVWESTYVYDIMLRVRELLNAETSATVHTTTRDGADYRRSERDVLHNSRGHKVLTDPPYAIEDVKVGANLRWYLANSLHREATRRSGDDAKTLFLSIHADSLHPSHRGMMVYVPAASLTKGEYGKTGTVYTRRREVKEERRVSFSWKERTRSEGLSRQLASHLLGSFRRHGLAIYHDKPIRDRIIRCRRCRPFVPAVVRYNAVPAKLLLEVCNLNNHKDRALLRTRAFRQDVAEAIVDAILAYYGQTPISADIASARELSRPENSLKRETETMVSAEP